MHIEYASLFVARFEVALGLGLGFGVGFGFGYGLWYGFLHLPAFPALPTHFPFAISCHGKRPPPRPLLDCHFCVRLRAFD